MTNTTNRAWCEVDPAAYIHNLRLIREYTKRPIMAVVKADAYGHWAREAARVLVREGVEFLAVATINEAVELYEAGIRAPTLILEPLTWEGDLREAGARGFSITVSSPDALAALRGLGVRFKVHLKIDTGMGRLGFGPDEAPKAAEELLAMGHRLEGAYTHFYSGHDPEAVREQLGRFKDSLARFPRRPKLLHSAATSALLTCPDSWLDMVRPGIAIYGVVPSPALLGKLPLRPALRFYARVLEVKTLPPGHPVSYGALYRTRTHQRVAVVGVGYADGFPLAAAGKEALLIKGKRRRVLGAVCMDMVIVDAEGDPPVRVGDIATIIGEGQSALDLAQLAGTHPYDILTGIGRRAKRIYKRI